MNRCSDCRVIRHMVTFGKQGSYCALACIQFQFFTGGTIAHVNMVRIFSNRFVEIRRDFCINQKMVVALAIIHTFFGWFYFHAINAHADFNRATNNSTLWWLSDFTLPAYASEELSNMTANNVNILIEMLFILMNSLKKN